MYDIYTAKYRMNTVVVKKPKFAFASQRLEKVTHFSLSGNKETFAIVGETACVQTCFGVITIADPKLSYHKYYNHMVVQCLFHGHQNA